MRLIFKIFLCFSILCISLATWASNTSCSYLFSQEFSSNNFAQGLVALNPTHRKYVKNIVTTVIGGRLLRNRDLEKRVIFTSKNKLVIPMESVAEDGAVKNIIIQFDSQKANNREGVVESTETSRTLYLPHNIDLSHRKQRENEVRQLFTGSPLHPYNSSAIAKQIRLNLGENSLKLKDAQQDAVSVIEESFKRGDDRFLFVASTGLGKTIVLLKTLEMRLGLSQEKKLFIVIADQIDLVDQVRGQIEDLTKGTGVKVMQWGGLESGGASIQTLHKALAESNTPIVLTTTRQTLIQRIYGLKGHVNSNLKILREHLSLLAYDEAHHIGAYWARKLVTNLIEHRDSSAFLYGTTATPVHREVGIQEMFNGKAFWALIDSVESFHNGLGNLERNVSDIVSQLALAINAGDLTPFNKITYIHPEIKENSEGDIFVKSLNQSAYTLNPDLYETIFKNKLRNVFKKHKKGFISCRNIQEAMDLTTYLNKNIEGKSFKVFHSKMKKEDAKSVRDWFVSGSDRIMVSVRKFDEGVDFPDMTLWIDTNKTIGGRQFMQRLGRLLRLHPGKDAVDIVLFSKTDKIDSKEKLELVNKMLEQKNISDEEEFVGLDKQGQKNVADNVKAHISPSIVKNIAESLIHFWKEEYILSNEQILSSHLNTFSELHHKYPQVSGKHKYEIEGKKFSEKSLYQRLYNHKKKPEYNEEELRQLLSKEADLFNFPSEPSLGEALALQLNAFTDLHHKYPQVGGKLRYVSEGKTLTEKTLYQNFRLYKKKSEYNEEKFRHLLSKEADLLNFPSELSARESLALHLNAFTELHHKYPQGAGKLKYDSDGKTISENTLYQNLRLHKKELEYNEKEFRSLLSEEANLLNFPTEPSAGESLALHLNTFTELHHKFPQGMGKLKYDRGGKTISENTLYQKLYRYMNKTEYNEEEFRHLLSREADLLSFPSESSVADSLALHLNAFTELHHKYPQGVGKLRYVRDGKTLSESTLYANLFRYKKQPEYNEEKFRHLLSKEADLLNFPSDPTEGGSLALHLNKFAELHHKYPQANGNRKYEIEGKVISEKNLHQRLYRLKKDPEYNEKKFRSLLSKEANTLSFPATLSTEDSIARDLNAFTELHHKHPQSTGKLKYKIQGKAHSEKTLYTKLLRHKRDPEYNEERFRSLLSEEAQLLNFPD